MIKDWIKILRPVHWVKNLFVLAPLLFAKQAFDSSTCLVSLAGAGLFCLLSSGVYAFNDVVDAERDRAHPLKSMRPVASGRISKSGALAVAGVLVAVAIAGAFFLDIEFGLACSAYLVLNVFYSLLLKRLAFFDVMTIAAGFVLRVVGGALVIKVVFSSWLVVCTFFLACLLGFGKRRHELHGQQDGQNLTRPSLSGYSIKSLKWAEGVASFITIVAYITYTFAPGTVAKFGGYQLLLTIPFPLFGILRYLKLVESRRDLAPTEALVTDAASVLNLAAWVGTVILGLYFL